MQEKNPYQDIDWDNFHLIKSNNNKLFNVIKFNNYWDSPKILRIDIDNYQGIIEILCNDTNKIEWYLDKQKIKTKYNVIGEFRTMFKVENLEGKKLSFVLKGNGGETHSKTFRLLSQEVL